jgi:uncharacterized membrane protein
VAVQEKAAVTIRRPAEELYRRWRDLSSLPTFMTHLASVDVLDDTRSHWVAKAPLGQVVEWDAEITEDRPGEVLAWQSTGDPDIANRGRVTFRPAPGDQGTEVLIEVSYDAPGGRLGALLAKVSGQEPREQVKDDLFRFKQLAETGEIARSAGSPGGIDAEQELHQRPGEPAGSSDVEEASR